MVQEIAQKAPILTAITVCVDVKDKPVVQPKKVGPPKVNISSLYYRHLTHYRFPQFYLLLKLYIMQYVKNEKHGF